MASEINITYVLDLVGTASFAFSGVLRGMRRRPDIVGMTILAGATAVGGGAIRDMVLHRPVVMLQDINYLLVILLAVLVTVLFPKGLRRNEVFFKYFDAIGLGVFSAIGASVAWDRGLNPLSVLFIASITGAGGGVIRDVLLGEMPLVLYREVYISAVVAGAGAMMLARWLGASEIIGFLIAMAIATTLRMVCIRFDWSLPRLGGRGDE